MIAVGPDGDDVDHVVQARQEPGGRHRERRVGRKNVAREHDVQILLLDLVFSLDSVITAVGMVKQIGVMIAAVVIAMIFMLVFVGRISAFIERHPTIKMLALSFLLMIGCALVAEGFHKEIPKGYIYFAMAFSMGVESLNIKLRAQKPVPKVELHQPYR